jgi:hypothetical protein
MVRIAEGREVVPALRRNGQLHLAYGRREPFPEASAEAAPLSNWCTG